MFRHWLMTDLLWAQRRFDREQDRRVREVIDEARAKRNLGLEHRGFPLTTRTPRG